jgi:hypothetical protein
MSSNFTILSRFSGPAIWFLLQKPVSAFAEGTPGESQFVFQLVKVFLNNLSAPVNAQHCTR